MKDQLAELVGKFVHVEVCPPFALVRVSGKLVDEGNDFYHLETSSGDCQFDENGVKCITKNTIELRTTPKSAN